MAPGALLFLSMLALLPSLEAAEIPVAGSKLELRGGRARRATVLLEDSAIAAPLPDPTHGAALVLSAGALPGQCHVEAALAGANWTAIRARGGERGYRYRAPKSGTSGVRRLVLKPGRLVVSAGGARWPCDLAAESQRLPVMVELRLDGHRYCAAFGEGAVVRNASRRFRARGAGRPAACPKTDLTVANLNILHGLFCPPETASCRADERIALLFQWLGASGCPDVVTLQEVWEPLLPLIRAHLATACPFAYQEVYVRSNTLDDEMILSRYPIVSVELTKLLRGFRTVLFARLDHPIGPVDVFSTHLASSSDGAQGPCTPRCPPECVSAGATTVRQCQGVQMANLVATRHDVPTPAVVTGDFNESPGTFVYQQFTGRGWLDTYLAAGNPECDPATGIGCTSGRADEELTDLESPVSGVGERIDFIFLVPPAAGSVCAATLDRASDQDGDGTATRIFTDLPNPFAPTCGAAPDAICWPSDHEGAELDLGCF